jgi:TetR/AcrR family transcriptional repressor of nem operon
MRYNTEHKQQTRVRIIEAAALAIRAHGARDIAVADVMQRAGLTHGGFYAHFASKEALLVAAIGRMFDGALATMTRFIGTSPARPGVAAYVGFYLSEGHRDARDIGCPLPIVSADLPHLTAAAQACYAQGLQNLAQALAGGLHPADNAGAHTQQALCVLAELTGILTLARALDPASSRTFLTSAREQILARLGLLQPENLP